MKKEEKNPNYSRLKILMSKVIDYLDSLPEDQNTEEFEILLLAHDIKNKVSGCYTLVNQEDPRESLVNCLDSCISGALQGKDKNPDEWEIFNAIGEYIIKVCALFPELYKSFQTEVENRIKDIKEDETRD